MENEIWKDIEGFGGINVYYQVSSLGRVRSVSRRGTIPPRILKGRMIHKKFYIAMDNIDGKSISTKVADLVANAFLDKEDGQEYVEHLDGNEENNRVDNLKWSNISIKKAKNRSISETKRKRNEYYITGNTVYVTMTGTNKHMICDLDDWIKYKDLTWMLVAGYACSNTNIDTPKRLKFHRLVMNAPEGLEVDHINHNTLDNRRENLRLVTHIVNMANRSRLSNNKTGKNGVYWSEKYKRYGAQMAVNGKKYDLGRYLTYEEAKAARIRAEYMYLIPFIEEGTITDAEI